MDELLTDRVCDALEKFSEAATDIGVSSATLALAWIMNHPDCTAPVVGPSRNSPHLGDVLPAMELHLDPEEHARIAALFAS